MKTKISVILLLLAFLGGAILYIDATILFINRLNVRYETLSDPTIPQELDDVTILYFSDVHYGNFVDDERFETIIETIKSLAPDIIIFGGDLFDDPTHFYPDSKIQSKAEELLSSLDAPLGKFAVLGDYDTQNELIAETVGTILNHSQFEILENKMVKIRNHGSQSINLVGISDASYASSAAYTSVSPNEYTITVVHNPDDAEYLSSENTNLLLAGHTMGNQLSIPFFRLDINQNAKYVKGKVQIGSMLLDITNGCGTTQLDARLFTDAEVVLYRLQSIDAAIQNSISSSQTENAADDAQADSNFTTDEN